MRCLLKEEVKTLVIFVTTKSASLDVNKLQFLECTEEVTKSLWTLVGQDALHYAIWNQDGKLWVMQGRMRQGYEFMF